MFNKEAFVQTTDQEFSWTMTHDGSGPLPAKQWFCFKFLCHSCFSKTSVIWGCPGPQSAIMRLDVASESRKVLFSLNVRYLFMQGLRHYEETYVKRMGGAIQLTHYECSFSVWSAQLAHVPPTSRTPSSGRSVQWTAFFTLSLPYRARNVVGRRCRAISCRMETSGLSRVQRSLALHFNIKLSEFGGVTPSLSWCQSLWTVVKVNILYRQSDYSAAEHVILWRKWQNINTQQTFHWLRGGGLAFQAQFHHSFSKMTSLFARLLHTPTGKLTFIK